MVILHLTSSTFFGGPERQILGLALHLAGSYRTKVVSFWEGGRCLPFLNTLRSHGVDGTALRNDSPSFLAAIKELADLVAASGTSVLCCHGYKADLLGRIAGRQCRVPVIAVSRGWTGETVKVRFYEALDRLCLRWMDRVVCVSEGQADKVRNAGILAERVQVIRNSIDTNRFDSVLHCKGPGFHHLLRAPCTRVVCAAGRLSPEKGFGVLVEAARLIVQRDPSTGFVLFGDGPLRQSLTAQVRQAGLEDRFVLAGFHDNLDEYLPLADVFVLPSFTEGLPNVVLEAFAAGVAVVATAVGGTPEVVIDGWSGHLVAPGNSLALARRILDLLECQVTRTLMARRGRDYVARHFTFASQARHYEELFDEIAEPRHHRQPRPSAAVL